MVDGIQGTGPLTLRPLAAPAAPPPAIPVDAGTALAPALAPQVEGDRNLAQRVTLAAPAELNLATLTTTLGAAAPSSTTPAAPQTPKQNFHEAGMGVNALLITLGGIFDRKETLGKYEAADRDISGLYGQIFQDLGANVKTLTKDQLIGLLDKTGAIRKELSDIGGMDEKDQAQIDAKKAKMDAFKDKVAGYVNELAGLLGVNYARAPQATPQKLFNEAGNTVNGLLLSLGGIFDRKETLGKYEAVDRDCTGLYNAIFSALATHAQGLTKDQLIAVIDKVAGIRKDLSGINGMEEKDQAQIDAKAAKLTEFKDKVGGYVNELAGMIGVNYARAAAPTAQKLFNEGATTVSGLMLSLGGVFDRADTLGKYEDADRAVSGLYNAVFKAQADGGHGLTKDQLIAVMDKGVAIRKELAGINGMEEKDQAQIDAKKAKLNEFKDKVAGYVGELSNLVGVPSGLAPAQTPQKNFNEAASTVNGMLLSFGGVFDRKDTLGKYEAADRDCTGLYNAIFRAQGDGAHTLGKDQLKAVMEKVAAIRKDLSGINSMEEKDQAQIDAKAAKLNEFKDKVDGYVNELAGMIGVAYARAPEPTAQKRFNEAAQTVNGVLLSFGGLFDRAETLEKYEGADRDATGLYNELFKQIAANAKGLTKDQLIAVMDKGAAIRKELSGINGMEEKDQAQIDAKKAKLTEFKDKVGGYVNELAALVGVSYARAPEKTQEQYYQEGGSAVSSLLLTYGGLFDRKENLTTHEKTDLDSSGLFSTVFKALAAGGKRMSKAGLLNLLKTLDTDRAALRAITGMADTDKDAAKAEELAAAKKAKLDEFKATVDGKLRNYAQLIDLAFVA